MWIAASVVIVVLHVNLYEESLAGHGSQTMDMFIIVCVISIGVGYSSTTFVMITGTAVVGIIVYMSLGGLLSNYTNGDKGKSHLV